MEFDVSTFLSVYEDLRRFKGDFILQGTTVITTTKINLFVAIINSLLKDKLIDVTAKVTLDMHIPDSYKLLPCYAKGVVTPAEWNSYGFTQLVHRKGNPDVWGVDEHCRTLLDMATHHVKGSPTSIVMFHGSSSMHKNSLLNDIRWTQGTGWLGRGFYLTLNFAEAFSYSCQRVKITHEKDIASSMVILEIVVSDADKLVIADINETPLIPELLSSHTKHKMLICRAIPKYGDIVRNTCSGAINQIAGRSKLIRNMKIVRTHHVTPATVKVVSVGQGNSTTPLRQAVPCAYYAFNSQDFNCQKN